MSVRFKLGADIRSWTEFEVKDATPEEIEILSGDDDAAVALAAALDAADRLIDHGIDYDDNPDLFAEYATPAIIDFEVTDEASQVGTES